MSASSVPPPSTPRPAPGATGATPSRGPVRVLTLKLDQTDDKRSWRRKLGTRTEEDRHIRLAGPEVVFEHPSTLQGPLSVAAGLIAVAAVEPRRPEAAEGRFPILRRMSATAFVPESDGVEGWLWTADSGSALPMLGDGLPNLALVFVKPLDPGAVEAALRPDALAALAQRSPLGAPVVYGLLARVTDPAAAEHAFGQIGVAGPLTDREVAPAQRRHLHSDVAADPSVSLDDAERRKTSVPPPQGGPRTS